MYTPLFSSVYNQEQSILDNLCTKQENLGLKSAIFIQEWVIIARAQYIPTISMAIPANVNNYFGLMATDSFTNFSVVYFPCVVFSTAAT